MTVLIAGGGIAGLTLGLTLHGLGVPFRLFEAARAFKPLGVGINLQPNAVRELFDMGFEKELERIGVRTREYGFYSKLGKEIWVEPRGRDAGYAWPQYSVHRGELQMMLFRRLFAEVGFDRIATGARVTGFRDEGSEVTLEWTDSAGEKREDKGALLVGADGVHSAIRKQMHPDEGEPIWGGAVLWRATTRAPAFRGGGSMALIGTEWQRIVAYPISNPDPRDGLCTMNWIAELKFDPSAGWNKEDWNREAKKEDILPKFRDWRFDWIDAPALIEGAETIFEYPMVDRDPLDHWTEGRVTLMGDAAHATYPVGSNGASQAIVDARVIGAELLAHGVAPDALAAYDARVRPVANAVVRANRGQGPDAVLQMVEDLCGGDFETIEDVIPREKLAAHAAKYKKLAGTDIEELNARPRTIPEGARVG